MKLLQVVWNFPATVMHPFEMYYFYWPVREAVLRGWDAEVLTFQVNEQQPAEEIIDGIYVRRCPAGRRKGRPFSRAFIQALLTTDADVIHCHGYGEGRSELAILLARMRGLPLIFSPHFHVYPYRRPLRDLYDKYPGRLFFNLSQRVIVFTEYTRQQLCALGVAEQRLRVVPHVSRPEIFADAPSRQEAEHILRAAGISGDPLILGVGQLIERKGWDYTVRCLPAIVKHFPEASLLIVGPSQPAEPAFRQDLLRLADELGVSKHLKILQDNSPEFIRAAYQGATLLTHPSFVESFGMVLLEALTAGLPVVAHNGSGIPCIIDDGITGYVLDVHNVPEYAQALLKLLSDPGLRQRMSTAGQRQAQTRFGQAEIAQRLFDIYEEVAHLPYSPPDRTERQDVRDSRQDASSVPDSV
ncbi:glycosyltransferase family 1 protein [Ktedonosporobacter rubrisoli]|uniref:Glycosyltransferase family 1 protein n=1 Tax=Ktedonosporobacter rubrisoli TaxID=2509675 RepID=A0A4P6K0N7_KTERU|nr:glycosyltransferase family 4 protein [Ktedonosporobacter rubrisoli]QBD81748.1 glycosyltransferase family 1 protein [Ktedonosporobacter rubrisoli]